MGFCHSCRKKFPARSEAFFPVEFGGDQPPVWQRRVPCPTCGLQVETLFITKTDKRTTPRILSRPPKPEPVEQE